MARCAPRLEEKGNKTWRRGEIYDARAIHEPWPMHEAVKASASCVQAKTLRNQQQEQCDFRVLTRR
ncbi:unnamed protein product [Arabidopsis halleri]